MSAAQPLPTKSKSSAGRNRREFMFRDAITAVRISAMHSSVHGLVTAVLLCSSAAGAQTTAVDYDRDVKPILREKCLGCHAGTQPQAGRRPGERRHAVLGAAVRARICAGENARSR